MSFCAFPSYGGPLRRRPALSVDLAPPVHEYDYGSSTNPSVICTSGSNTPLHTTDIIAAEYMTASPMWMDSDDLFDDSLEVSSQSSFNYSSYSFQDTDRDGYQTPLSSLASSPKSPSLPTSKEQTHDEIPRNTKNVGTEKKAQRRSPTIDPNEWQPQNLILRQLKGSKSLHQAHKVLNEWQCESPLGRQAKGSISLRQVHKIPHEQTLSKNLLSLPSIAKSRSVKEVVRSRTSVARRIAAMAGKPSKSTSGASNCTDHLEVRILTTPMIPTMPTMPLAYNPALPFKPLLSRPKAPKIGSSMPVFTSERARKPDILSLKRSTHVTKTNDDFSSYPLPRHVPKDMSSYGDFGPYDSFEAASTAAEISSMKSNRYPSYGLSSNGHDTQTATQAMPFPETMATKFISTKHVYSRSADQAPIAINSRASSKMLVVDETALGRRPFPHGGYFHGPTPPPPLTYVHFHCFQFHQNMNLSKNDLAPVPCMTCRTDDSELRWKCSWCCLRICIKCMESLEGSQGRNLETLIAARAREGIGYPLGYLMDRRA